jgi:hypothetical protein
MNRVREWRTRAAARWRPSEVSVCAPWLDTLSYLYQIVLRVNSNHCEKNRERTYIGDQRSRAEEQEVDRLLFGLDVPADIIHGADQAGVCP